MSDKGSEDSTTKGERIERETKERWRNRGGNALQDGATVGTSDSGSGNSELAEREERRNVLEETECRRARFVGGAVGRRNAVGKVGDSGGRIRDSALRWLGASIRDGRFDAFPVGLSRICRR